MDNDIDFSIFLNDSYLQGTLIHEIFACLFFIPYLWYLYTLFTFKTYLNLNHKMYFITPITIFLLCVALATGIFLLAMRNFILDSKISLMIIVCIIFLAGEIYRLVSIKKAKISKENMAKYVKKAKIMYLFFFFLYLFTIAFCKINII
ncbi:hypothetical protein DCO58_05075 [Helicobacter saguini]|uniref:TerC family integral membrane protein n=1 Tax=Helicobacter saguini TaxID=1548018 RepID=A0A347VT14_9HELI|nr:hypothetical protein [Helicobacter saguini]MWV62278.1 hypothetical protein [Helicobacter saguini]MWV67049.1 hypothetical protein [Helicobacter saguini]MWV69399.1 hypothetical protein [Helicobacter saguini]MWV71047.1 hypothetical protein [Helicobacter saguini]TLD95048.1 hypothetical protein LS64_003835 [Helicobacter saguini]